LECGTVPRIGQCVHTDEVDATLWIVAGKLEVFEDDVSFKAIDS